MFPSASSKTWIGSRLSMHSESAVVSMTLRPRSIASRCVSSGRNCASGSRARVAVVDALDAVLRHQDRLGADLERAQRRGRVGGEERVAGAGREDDDPALLEVADRAAADVRLGDLGDRDGRLHARLRAEPLERVLERERVEDGREHPRVVGGRTVHALGRRGHAAVDVPAADDDRELDAGRLDGDDLARRSRRPSSGRCRTRGRPSAPRRRASAGRGGTAERRRGAVAPAAPRAVRVTIRRPRPVRRP